MTALELRHFNQSQLAEALVPEPPHVGALAVVAARPSLSANRRSCRLPPRRHPNLRRLSDQEFWRVARYGDWQMVNGYVQAAIDGETARLASAIEGERNQTLFKSTAALASFWAFERARFWNT